jgi:hypothetical protein
MHAVGLDSQRDVEAIVDQQRSAVARALHAHGLREFVEFAPVQILFTQLDCDRARRSDGGGHAQRRRHRRRKAAMAPRELAIGNQVQQEPRSSIHWRARA